MAPKPHQPKDFGDEINRWRTGNEFEKRLMEKHVLRRISKAPDAGFLLRLLGTLQNSCYPLLVRTTKAFKERMVELVKDPSKKKFTAAEVRFAISGLITIGLREFMACEYKKQKGR